MNLQENRRLIRTFLLKQDASVLADDVIVRDQAQEQTFYGRQAATSFLDAYFVVGFAKCEAEVQTLVAGEEDVVLAFTFRGRQHGPFMGIPQAGCK